MGTVHQLIEAHGKQKALQFDIDRRIVETAHDYMSDEEGGGRLHLLWLCAGRTAPQEIGR